MKPIGMVSLAQREQMVEKSVSIYTLKGTASVTVPDHTRPSTVRPNRIASVLLTTSGPDMRVETSPGR